VFTDNTLIAIAETPTDDAALVESPASRAKLEQYGPDVLAMVKGRQSS
jgi:DNA helicase-2/ATP-dependent DNA helicase PcrA